LIVGALVLVDTWALAEAAEGGEVVSQQPAPDPDATWELDTTLSGNRYALSNDAPSQPTDGTTLGLGFGLTRFLAPLRDDGAPYSLQPFLQRTSSWLVSIGGSHFATRNPFGGPDRTDWSGSLSGSLDVYLKRWLAVTVGLGSGYSVLHDVGVDQSTTSFSGSVGLGVRAGDTRVDVSYSRQALDSAGSDSSRQFFEVSGFTAIARRFTLNPSATLISGGAEGDLSLEYFPTRELGIFGGALAGKGKLYSDDAIPTRYAGWVGVAGWIDPAFGIVGRYQLTFEELPEQAVDGSLLGYQEVTHALTLEVYARFDSL
jgi:hypothetical protein